MDHNLVYEVGLKKETKKIYVRKMFKHDLICQVDINLNTIVFGVET